jgi:anti-sigma factor RsiW
MQTAHPDSRPVLSEADIQAFVDGLLAPERAAQMRRYLRDRPDEARRVAFYGKLNWQMQSSFQSADDADRKRRYALRVALLAGWLRRRARVIAAALLVAFCVTGGFAWATHIPDTTLDAAAIMTLEQAVAIKDSPDRDADATPLAAAPDLSGVGFRAVAHVAQQLGPFARARGFIYRNAAGERAVLLSVPDLIAAPRPQWQARRVGESRVLDWTVGRTKFVLAGRASTRGLMRAADLMTSR